MKKTIITIIIFLLGFLLINPVKANVGLPREQPLILEYFIEEVSMKEYDDVLDYGNKYEYYSDYKKLTPDVDFLVETIESDKKLFNEIHYSIMNGTGKFTEWYFAFEDQYNRVFSHYRLSKDNFNPGELITTSTEARFNRADADKQIKLSAISPIGTKEEFITTLFDRYPEFYINYYDSNNSKYQFSFSYFNYDENDYDIKYYMFENRDVIGLPETDSETIAGVDFKVDEHNNVEIKITYEKKFYYINKSFDIKDDLSIFDTIEAYYINVDDNPQIIINHSDRPYLREILSSKEGEKPAFVPHTIWDLNSNNLKTISEYNTYVYLKQNHKSVMMAYMYIDEFIIDRLLNIELSWTSRIDYGKFNGFLTGNRYSDWERNTEILSSDKYLTYKNLTSSWQNYVPIWNYYIGIRDATKTYEMPRVAAVDFQNIQSEYNITRSEYETYMFRRSDEFQGLKDNPRYKVWALALEQGIDAFGTKTDLYDNKDNHKDPYNFNIIRMTYETNGRLYEAVGEDMNIIVKVNPKDDGLDKENENGPGLITTIIFFGAFGLWILAIFTTKAFTLKKFFIVTFILFSIYAAAFFGWGYVKSGKIFLKLIKIL